MWPAVGVAVYRIDTPDIDLLTIAPHKVSHRDGDRAEPGAEVNLSLAEKLPAADGLVRAHHATPTANIDNILRLALNGAGQRPSMPERAVGDVDFGKAAILLDRATAAISHLTSRRDELEQSAAAREDYYADKIRQLQDQAIEWERRAKVTKAQLQDSEARISEQQGRIETLTYRAEHAEARVLIAEQQAGEARKQLQLYHDKIIETFGTLV